MKMSLCATAKKNNKKIQANAMLRSASMLQISESQTCCLFP